MVQNPSSTLDQICVSNQRPRTQRRIHGLQLPLHPQQVLGWITILITLIVNFGVIVPIQKEQFQTATWSVLLALYILHGVAHVTALLSDPAERQLRRLSRSTVPEFDRNLHAHVIENGRCHLCNIQTTSKNTKHCSICNKCVGGFDHHCKWLNHCIGKRNYAAFFVSVATSTLLTFVVAVICFCDITFYFLRPQLLSENNVIFRINISNSTNPVTENDINWTFCIVCPIYGFINLVISCVLLHLCSFHVYISILGVSTYEYIVRNIDLEDEEDHPKSKTDCKRAPCPSKPKQKGQLTQSQFHFCQKVNKWQKNKVGDAINTVSTNVPNEISALPSHVHNAIVEKTTNFNYVTYLMTVILHRLNDKNHSIMYQQRKQIIPMKTDVITKLPSNAH